MSPRPRLFRTKEEVRAGKRLCARSRKAESKGGMGEGRAREDCSLKAPCCRSCARYGWMQTEIKGHPGEPLLPQTTAVSSSRRETLESPFSPNPSSRSPTLSRSPRETPFSLRLRQPGPHSHPGSPHSPQDPGSQSPTLSRSPRATRESPFSPRPRPPPAVRVPSSPVRTRPGRRPQRAAPLLSSPPHTDALTMVATG